MIEPLREERVELDRSRSQLRYNYSIDMAHIVLLLAPCCRHLRPCTLRHLLMLARLFRGWQLCEAQRRVCCYACQTNQHHPAPSSCCAVHPK